MTEPTESPPANQNQPSSSPIGCRTWLGITILALLIGMLGAAAGAGAVYLRLRPQETPVGQVATIEPTPAAPTPTAAPLMVEVNTQITNVVQEVGPSVVTVVSDLPNGAQGAGSGVIISDQGHIVTNDHVVDGATSLHIMLADGSALPATLIGSDSFADLAVVQVQADMPSPASWGDSDALSAGETVIAIGSPLGDFVNTVTVGVISNVSRSIDVGQGFQLQDLIQTDAAINQGNSGGPLINLAGQIVGINTLIVRGDRSGASAEGLGFAIPSNSARAITAQLIENGEVSRPYMGIEWRWITPDISSNFELPVDYGVFITGIVPGGPASQAGLQRGDILVSFGDQPFDADHPFINLLYEYKPGDSVTVEFLRAQQPLQATELILDLRPSS